MEKLTAVPVIRMNTDHAHFGMVPCEIMVHIFDQISHRDRKRARQVCHRWNQILSNYPKYFIFRAKWNNRSLKSVLNSYLSMDRLVLLNLTKRIPKNPLPDIREAILGWRNSQANVANFLRRCQKAEAKALTITKLSLGEISAKALRKTLSGIEWNSLAELKINVTLTKYKYARVKTHLENCTLLLELIQVPSVRILDFDFTANYECDDCEKREMRLFHNLCLAFYQFMWRNALSIKILKCSLRTIRQYSGKFSIPDVPDHMKESIVQQLNLESCVMKFYGVRQIENIVTPTLFGSKLQSLELDTFNNITKDSWSPHSYPQSNLDSLDKNLQTIFTPNGKSLQNVRLQDFPMINFAWFKYCCSLEIVELLPLKRHLKESPTHHPFEACSKTLRSLKIQNLPHVALSWFQNCLELETFHILHVQLLVQRSINESSLHLRPLPTMKLKNLSLYFYHTTREGEVEIQQWVDRSCQTLEHLKLHGDITNISLNNLFALKSLNLWVQQTHLLINSTATAANFTKLTKLYIPIFLSNYGAPALIDWVIQNLKNLEDFEEIFSPDLGVIQKILPMPKLKLLRLHYHDREKLNHIKANFENIPGLKLQNWKGPFPDHINLNYYLLLVDRDVYNVA